MMFNLFIKKQHLIMYKLESFKDIRIWLVIVSMIIFFVLVFKSYPAG